VYCKGSGAVESVVLTPELKQGLRVYDFVADNSNVDVFFQKRLNANESYLQLNSKGAPLHFILPYPFDYTRQLSCMHEWGHYLDERPRKDDHLHNLLKKPKAAYKNEVVRNVLVDTELIAWTHSLKTIHEQEFVFPAESWLSVIVDSGLRAYFDLFKGEIDDERRGYFQIVFGLIDKVSPGFLQLPAIVNYFHDASSK
jgi:hypothetical protein